MDRSQVRSVRAEYRKPADLAGSFRALAKPRPRSHAIAGCSQSSQLSAITALTAHSGPRTAAHTAIAEDARCCFPPQISQVSWATCSDGRGAIRSAVAGPCAQDAPAEGLNHG